MRRMQGCRFGSRFRVLWSLALAVSCVACASYSDHTKAARTALDAGAPKQALDVYNDRLNVESAKELPSKFDGDQALLVLERSTILQSLRQYELSARDLQVADKQIELLDFSRSTADDIGKYLFSDDTGPYRAPFYEMLMINTMNMINYLVLRDLQGAKVEARRLAVLQKYIKDRKSGGAELTGPGSYLAGFIFEKSGDPQEALRYYDEALQAGSFSSLEEPIVRLSRRASYRSPRITEVLEKAGEATPAPGSAPEPASEQAPEDESAPSPPPAAEPKDDSAELLVVVNYGRVPAKIAKRVPIGLALTYASDALSPYDRERANRMALQGLVTWVNYPTLGKPRGNYAIPFFILDGHEQSLEEALAVDIEAKKDWERGRGAIVASAITRAIARIIAGQAAGKASKDGAISLLLSLGTQVALTAADTPDTRSWSTLPARIAIGRVRIPAGTHWVDLEARGRRERYKVVVRPGDWAVVNLTELR